MAEVNLKPLNRNLVPRSALPTRVIQFGEGNFLRAFVDWIIHRMNESLDFEAGVTVVQPIDQGLVKILNAQGGLYTLYLNGLRNGEVVSEHELIDCIQKGINPYHDFAAFLREAENPHLRFLISNTTEAGIEFMENDQPDDKPPTGFPAKLTVFLNRRYRKFMGDPDMGCIILPCELIDRNGDKLKKIILQYATLWKLDPGFAEWLETSNIFCNTLVDRIVPGYPHDRIETIWKELGYQDQLVVEGEQFHLWVIEGPASVQEAFPADQAGLNVLFTDDMAPYRTRKVRILNGAHTSMVPVAFLYGLETVKETVEDPVLGPFVTNLIYEEIIPTLDLPEEELKSFAADVLDRFKNPFIKHYLISIALNSTSKFETRVLPSLLEFQLRTGKLPRHIVFSMAALIRFYQGEAGGGTIPLKDDADRLEFFRDLWAAYDQRELSLPDLVRTVLARENYWGQDLNSLPGLPEMLVSFLETILEKGMKEALDTRNLLD